MKKVELSAKPVVANVATNNKAKANHTEVKVASAPLIGMKPDHAGAKLHKIG